MDCELSAAMGSSWRTDSSTGGWWSVMQRQLLCYVLVLRLFAKHSPRLLPLPFLETARPAILCALRQRERTLCSSVMKSVMLILSFPLWSACVCSLLRLCIDFSCHFSLVSMQPLAEVTSPSHAAQVALLNNSRSYSPPSFLVCTSLCFLVCATLLLFAGLLGCVVCCLRASLAL